MSKVSTPVVSVTYGEIQKRNGERITAEEGYANLAKPHMLSEASQKDYKKSLKSWTDRFLEASLMVTWDFRVLEHAINSMQIDHPEIAVGQYITKAGEEIKVSRHTEAILAKRAAEKEEADRRAQDKADKADKAARKASKAASKWLDEEEAARKARGECKGQMKLLKDDGSIAEPASEVVTTKIEPEPISEVVQKAQDKIDDSQTRDLPYGFMLPSELNNLMDLFRAGDVDAGRQKLNELIEEKADKKGRNALFKKVFADLEALVPKKDEKAKDPKPTPAQKSSASSPASATPKGGAKESQPEEKPMSELQKKAAEKKAKAAAAAKK